MRLLKKYHHTIILVLLLLLTVAHPAQAAIVPLVFTVNMSEPVNVVTTGGTPYIQLNIGGVSDSTKRAGYTAGTGTAALSFSYTPAPGDVDLDGITLVSPVELNGGALSDINGNPITNRTFTLPDTSGVKIDYPSLSMDFTNGSSGRYTLNGTAYNSFSAFQTASSATFTRNSIATYFDSSGNLQTASTNTPRFDHDPVTNAPKGILIEESRTNLIPYSMASGAVIGTMFAGGSMPTNWSVGNWDPGVTLSITGTGAVSGLSYIDFRIVSNGTLEGDGQINFADYGEQAIAAQNDLFTESVYIAIVSGSTANLNCRQRITENQGGSYLTKKVSSILTITGTLTRFSSALTLTNAATTRARPSLECSITGSGIVDATIRIAAPQLEKANFATSYIPTSGSVVTRAAEYFTVPVGGWYNASTSTVNAKYNIPTGNSTNNKGIFSLNTNASNKTDTRANGVSNTTVGGVGMESLTRPAATGSLVKIAKAIADNNYALITNNNAIVTDTSSAVPAVARLQVGGLDNDSTGVLSMSGYLESLKYYPARLADPQLQLLTAP